MHVTPVVGIHRVLGPVDEVLGQPFDTGVVRTGFEEHDLPFASLGDPSRDDGPRRSRSNDDRVGVILHAPSLLARPRPAVGVAGARYLCASSGKSLSAVYEASRADCFESGSAASRHVTPGGDASSQ